MKFIDLIKQIIMVVTHYTVVLHIWHNYVNSEEKLNHLRRFYYNKSTVYSIIKHKKLILISKTLLEKLKNKCIVSYTLWSPNKTYSKNEMASQWSLLAILKFLKAYLLMF